jgi:hypothetical protein
MSWANRPWHQRLLHRHTPAKPTNTWQAEQQIVDGPQAVTLPEDLADGEYLWEITLVSANGRRLPLDGYCDGQERVRLGYLVVRDEGATLAYRAVEDLEPRSAWQDRHVNLRGREIDFEPVRTDGSIALRRVDGEWHLRTLPRERTFSFWFHADAVAMPKEIQAELPDGRTVVVLPRVDGESWGWEPNGARLYRWSNVTARVDE